jgi:hypothetical protein
VIYEKEPRGQVVTDEGIPCTARTCCTRLNRLEEENKELKFILQGMGLLMTDEEVRDIRTEIASKLIKPLFKGNGFDVDVNVENGFTIIPKSVNNNRE